MRKRSESGESAGRVRVLVADDSAYMRIVIGRLLTSDPDIEVVGTAQNGAEAVRLAQELQPDLVTLDIEMPVLDGTQALRRIMAESPRPVVMVSTLTRHGADITLACLQAGAVDFICKPEDPSGPALELFRRQALRKVKAAAQARVEPVTPPPAGPPEAPTTPAGPAAEPLPAGVATGALATVAIASSTGGPRAVQTVLSALPANLPACVLITQHLPPPFTTSFAERLDGLCGLRVREGAEGNQLAPGAAFIAPGDYHLVLRPSCRLHLLQTPPVWSVRPAADVMMRSVAQVGGANAVAVVLTGMGCDGAEGAALMKRAGAVYIAQDEATSVVYGMPRAALATGCVDEVLPIEDIAAAIVAAVARQRSRAAREGQSAA